jgi:hypothetical protein
LRPSPREEFTAELDARVAAGFPRSDKQSAPVRRFLDRLRATPPRRLLAPTGGLALAAIVVATATVALSENRPDPSERLALDASGSGSPAIEPPGGPALRSEKHGETATSEGNSSGVRNSSGVQFSDAPSAAAPSRLGAGEFLLDEPSAGSSLRQRDIERAAQVVLGADPSEVRTDAAKVFDAVHAVDGIVLRSSIRDGSGGEAGAEFELLIPSSKLGDALADFSRIGEVRSRRDAKPRSSAPSWSA